MGHSLPADVTPARTAGGGNVQIELSNSDRFPVLFGDRLLGLRGVAAVRSIAGITQRDRSDTCNRLFASIVSIVRPASQNRCLKISI